MRNKRQASSEVDLVYQYDDKIIPIKIKSGATGSLKSLHEFIERTNHHYAIPGQKHYKTLVFYSEIMYL